MGLIAYPSTNSIWTYRGILLFFLANPLSPGNSKIQIQEHNSKVKTMKHNMHEQNFYEFCPLKTYYIIILSQLYLTYKFLKLILL